MTKFFINAGHGGVDCGAVNKNLNLYEKDVALQLSNALKDTLIAQGMEAEVYQQGASLNEVPVEANKSGADYFVSIHLNAFDTTARGVEVLYYPSSTIGKSLAQCVQDKLTETIDGYTFTDRGIKADSRNLLVLRATTMPAILCEVGFIDNDTEAEFVTSHISELATKIAQGLLNYIGIEYVEDDVDIDLVIDTNILDSMEIIPTGYTPIITTKDSITCGSITADLYISGKLVLKGNKLSTIETYLINNYCS